MQAATHPKAPDDQADHGDDEEEEQPEPFDQEQLLQENVDCQDALHPLACTKHRYVYAHMAYQGRGIGGGGGGGRERDIINSFICLYGLSVSLPVPQSICLSISLSIFIYLDEQID